MRKQPRSPCVKRENMYITRYCLGESNLDLLERARWYQYCSLGTSFKSTLTAIHVVLGGTGCSEK